MLYKRLILYSKVSCSNILTSVGIWSLACCFPFEIILILKCLVISGYELMSPWRNWALTLMGSVDGWRPDAQCQFPWAQKGRSELRALGWRAQTETLITIPFTMAFQGITFAPKGAPPHGAFLFPYSHMPLLGYEKERSSSFWGSNFLEVILCAPISQHLTSTQLLSGLLLFSLMAHLDQRSESGCGGRQCMHLGNGRGAPRASF